MPNLRKRSSVLTYNDDAIYKAIENQRSNGEARRTNGPNVILKTVNKASSLFLARRKIPEFVYANDGRKFYPCSFCCHAFAYKELQLAHVQQCSFRVVKKILKPRQLTKVTSTNKQYVLKTEITFSKDQPVAKTIKSKPKQFKTNPKVAVQKSKLGLHSTMENGAMKIVKRLPAKIKFPKINLQPSVGNQNISFLKQPKKVKPKGIYSCPHCNNIFASSMSLVQHKRENHMFAKIYVSANKLKEYDEMFKNSDMSKCTICFKQVTKIRWGRHLQTHTNERNYSCNFCKKSFGRKDHLNVHEKTHILNLENPFDITQAVKAV